MPRGVKATNNDEFIKASVETEIEAISKEDAADEVETQKDDLTSADSVAKSDIEDSKSSSEQKKNSEKLEVEPEDKTVKSAAKSKQDDKIEPVVNAKVEAALDSPNELAVSFVRKPVTIYRDKACKRKITRICGILHVGSKVDDAVFKVTYRRSLQSIEGYCLVSELKRNVCELWA